MVQGYVAHFHHPGSLAQLTHLVHVVGDAVYLSLVAVGNSTGAEHPVCRETKNNRGVTVEVSADGDHCFSSRNRDLSKMCEVDLLKC